MYVCTSRPVTAQIEEDWARSASFAAADRFVQAEARSKSVTGLKTTRRFTVGPRGSFTTQSSRRRPQHPADPVDGGRRTRRPTTEGRSVRGASAPQPLAAPAHDRRSRGSPAVLVVFDVMQIGRYDLREGLQFERRHALHAQIPTVPGAQIIERAETQAQHSFAQSSTAIMKAWSRQTASRYQALTAIPLETFANRISPIRLRKPTTTRIISEARTGLKDPRSRPLAMCRALLPSVRFPALSVMGNLPIRARRGDGRVERP